jgi:hypothetical protein
MPSPDQQAPDGPLQSAHQQVASSLWRMELPGDSKHTRSACACCWASGACQGIHRVGVCGQQREQFYDLEDVS